MPSGSRLALCLLALLLFVSWLVQGRIHTVKGGDAAFSVAPPPGSVTVRLEGDFPSPGVYRFPDGVTTLGAIKMTLPEAAAPLADPATAAHRLASGDVLILVRSQSQTPVLSIGSMPTRERMLLGIPLDPDLLDQEGWAALPGIGPVLAARIVTHRQKYGAFGSLDGVIRVPGVGPGKIGAIRRYF